jgi:hypothetical protein
MFLFKPNIKKLKAKRDYSGLYEATGYQDEEIRKQAQLAIMELDVEHALALLIKALRYDAERQSFSSLTDVDVYQAIGSIKNQKAYKFLCDYLENVDWEIRRAAVVALGEIAKSTAGGFDRYWKAGKRLKKSAVSALAAALKDEYKEVREAAVKGLKKISTAEAEEALKDLEKEREINKKRAKKLATEWWKFTGKSKGLCDWCNRQVSRNQGYLTEPRLMGITIKGELLDLSGSPDLICDECFAKDPDIKPFSQKKFVQYKIDYKKTFG